MYLAYADVGVYCGSLNNLLKGKTQLTLWNVSYKLANIK